MLCVIDIVWDMMDGMSVLYVKLVCEVGILVVLV